jgi:ATP-dependent exoDNAse (exonuclease V) beta subunit
MTRLPDSVPRQQALDIHTSFVVQAPAGSGKTELLISRLLALFSDDATQSPEQVLAITFTRKAAAEMVTRLLGALRAADSASNFDDWLLITHHGDADKAEGLKQKPDALSLKQQQYHWAKRVLQKDWSLLTNPHRLRITTIDGFCNALARQTPLLGQLAPGLDVADDVLYLYDMAARQTLAQLETADESPLSDAIALLLPAFGNNLDKLRDLLSEHLANRDQWLTDLDELDTDKMQSVLARLFAPQLLDFLSSFQSDLPELSRLAGVCLQGLLANGDTDSEVHQALTLLNDCGLNANELPLAQQLLVIQGIAFLLVTKDKKGWRKVINKTMGFAAATSKPDIASLKRLLERYEPDAARLVQLQSLVSLPNPTYSDDDHQRIAALKTLFAAAARQLLLVFAEHRQTDHAQFTQAALVALDPVRNGNVSDVLLKLDAQLRHILIDEFQDTSVSQWALLRHLMAGWESVGQGQEKQGRSLFLVGDPMQSIYRFRKAEPALFTTAKTQGIPLDNGQHFKLLPLQLSSNFRSLPAMITFANDSFSDIFPNEAQAQADVSLGACSYSPAQAVKDDKTKEASIALWHQTDAKKCGTATWYDADLTQASPSLTRAEHSDEQDAAQRIRVWLESEKPQAPSSVAILVRSKAHLIPILAELTTQGIAVHAEEISTLTDRWYIQDCLALTRFLVDPSDRVAFLAVLRAPWCGLSLTALHTLAQQPDPIWEQIPFFGKEGLGEIPPDDLQRLTQFIAALAPLMHQRGHQPLATQVRSACLALGLFSLLPDESAADDVAVYWDLLRQLQQVTPHFDLPTLNKKLDKLFAKPSHPNAPVVAMTIHKSKGLEFDTVILPSLDKRGATDSAGLITWQKLAEGDGLHDIIAPLGKDKSPLFAWLQSLEKKKAEYELDRLLYVAVTRAVKQLILIATLVPSKDKATKDKEASFKLPAASNTLMGCLWKSEKIKKVTEEVLSKLTVPETDESDAEEASAMRAQPRLLRFDAQQLATAQASLNQSKHYLVAAAPVVFLSSPERQKDVPANEDNDGTAAAIGTVTHALLERIANDGLSAWHRERLLAQRRWLHYQLRGLAVPEAKQDKAIATILQAIENTLSDEQGQWILQHWQQARNEWALMDVDDVTGKLQRHILDRSFVDAQGVRWIIDYKTSQNNGLALDAFIAAKCAQYQAQLERYRQLVQQLDPRHPIQTALFFPLLPAGSRWQLIA